MKAVGGVVGGVVGVVGVVVGVVVGGVGVVDGVVGGDLYAQKSLRASGGRRFVDLRT